MLSHNEVYPVSKFRERIDEVDLGTDHIITKNTNDKLNEEITKLTQQLDSTSKENQKLKKNEVKRLTDELQKKKSENEGLKDSIDKLSKMNNPVHEIDDDDASEMLDIVSDSEEENDKTDRRVKDENVEIQ